MDYICAIIVHPAQMSVEAQLDLHGLTQLVEQEGLDFEVCAAGDLGEFALADGDVLLVSSGRTVYEVSRFDLTPLPGVRAQVEAVSHKIPGTILVGLNERDKKVFDLYRIDLLTGERTLLAHIDARMIELLLS